MDRLTTHLGLLAVAFLAATILPGSSEALLTALVLKHPSETPSLLVAATAGNTAGGALNWMLGRWLSDHAGRRWFPVSRRSIERASAWFRSYGAGLLLFSWVPVVGDPLTVAAGLLRFRFMPFLVLIALGKAARYAAVIGAVEAVRRWI